MNTKKQPNTSKRLIAFFSMFITMVLLVSVIGCGGQKDPNDQGTIQFTDSVGRVVEIPSKIERVAPSGTLAQIILYT
ncbi:MAG: hypothetical protein FWC25_02625 [Dehalococcoidia bacterium]|nr:hypothetical protein [Dehalococcoidia bacterium]